MDKEAEKYRREVYRKMTAEQKIQVASDLFWSAWDLKFAYYKKLYPELTEAELEKKVRDWVLYART